MVFGWNDQMNSPSNNVAAVFGWYMLSWVYLVCIYTSPQQVMNRFGKCLCNMWNALPTPVCLIPLQFANPTPVCLRCPIYIHPFSHSLESWTLSFAPCRWMSNVKWKMFLIWGVVLNMIVFIHVFDCLFVFGNIHRVDPTQQKWSRIWKSFRTNKDEKII